MTKTILTLSITLLLLSACNKHSSIARATDQIRSENSVASKKKTPDFNSETEEEVAEYLSSDCLTPADNEDIDNFIAQLKIAIAKNDTIFIESIISAPPMDADVYNIDLVKEYFNLDLIKESLKSELEIDERFSQPDENGCCYFIVGRDFPELEYSVVFDLRKRDSKITISTITLIG
ncbi:hypothetical protein G3O08_06490 [Cryomorpha ignava]|uniref:Uncharacterized protein n=1 Tax=Cryomorpha ignava TaxID=101383 RepID=A0A7K3WR05_9FLAO|nr:hypothetical protein [Cryomorpha ignava]NEN23145.1 hypothetical protein [Cryomorpha ignava]